MICCQGTAITSVMSSVGSSMCQNLPVIAILRSLLINTESQIEFPVRVGKTKN